MGNMVSYFFINQECYKRVYSGLYGVERNNDRNEHFKHGVPGRSHKYGRKYYVPYTHHKNHNYGADDKRCYRRLFRAVPFIYISGHYGKEARGENMHHNADYAALRAYGKTLYK